MDVYFNAVSSVVPLRAKEVFLSLLALLIFVTPSASAQSVEDGCMQDIAGFDLQCTANDIQIAGVAENPDGSPQLEILDDGCAFPGDEVTFTATFDVVTTAKERHDVGIYFVTDGDPNGDGAISGSCSISVMPFDPDPPWLDLDGTDDPFPGTHDPSGIQDTCGDIDKPDHNPLHPTITLTATCVDPDNDGFLNLPNCTSWRQAGANELCTSPTDAFPGSPSKCRCDDAFNIPIEVPPAVLDVSKTASPTEVNESGDLVTFSVSVTNVGIDPDNTVDLYSLEDDIYSNIATTGHDGIVSTTCSVPQTIPADDQNPGGIDTYECEFTVDVQGNAFDVITDVVTATAQDTRGNTITGSDDATVTILDVLPDIDVVKNATPTEVSEPGGTVTFDVSVTNTSLATSDTVIINSLNDSIHGDLNGQGDCSMPQVLAHGATYNCSFTGNVTGNAFDSETDVVTASGTDDESNPVSASDSATVVILNVPSTISIVKTANPTSVTEPGGNVTYSVTVNNTSTVDTVTISSLVDDILGDLNGQGSCVVPQTITTGGSYSCNLVALVEGNAGDAVVNVVTANGTDDDDDPIMATDDATVDVENAAPAASLVKTAGSAVVTFNVTVSNDSDAESLTVDALNDDQFGDITQIQGKVQSTTCIVPQVLQPAGDFGDTYTCSFDALVDTSPHTNTLTGTVSDDDGSLPVTPSDSATVTLE